MHYDRVNNLDKGCKLKQIVLKWDYKGFFLPTRLS